MERAETLLVNYPKFPRNGLKAMTGDSGPTGSTIARQTGCHQPTNPQPLLKTFVPLGSGPDAHNGVFGREGNVIIAFKTVETEQPPPILKRRRRQLTNDMFSRLLQPFSNRRRRRRRMTVLNATVVTSRTDVGLLKIYKINEPS